MTIHYEDRGVSNLDMTDLECKVFSQICEQTSILHTVRIKDLDAFVSSFQHVGDDRTIRKTLASLTAKGALFRRATTTTTFYLHPNPYICWKGSLRNQDYQRDVWDVLVKASRAS